MSIRRAMIESVVGMLGRMASGTPVPPPAPDTIFVLRNNDIGDLIVVTPLFEALRKRFPSARIVAGIGDWNRPVLENNPWVDEVMSVNAPWHNKPVCRFPHNSLRGWWDAIRYVCRSPEIAKLRQLRADVGIDVLGSPQGALLLMRAGIPHRLGVRGYAGGHTGVQQYLEFDDQVYVGRFALRFAERLGLPEANLPAPRPQLFLTRFEQEEAETVWAGLAGSARRRVVVGFGGGHAAKCWPQESFRQLLEKLGGTGSHAVILVGGQSDQATGEALAKGLAGVTNLAGRLSLRQTFALTAASEQVITNSSMLMHVAAAFDRPAVVVLGEEFSSAIAHARLWNQSANVRVLGMEGAGTRLASVQEAYESLCK